MVEVAEIPVNGTLVWYYHICKREVWLMSRQLTPDEDDQLLQMGRLVGTTAYRGEKQQIRLENITIDLAAYDRDGVVVGEVKKSSRFKESAKMQLCYYLYVLKRYGIEARGVMLFPREKKREEVLLTAEVEKRIEAAIDDIRSIAAADLPPPAKKIGYCSSCAYREFCWS